MSMRTSTLVCLASLVAAAAFSCSGSSSQPTGFGSSSGSSGGGSGGSGSGGGSSSSGVGNFGDDGGGMQGGCPACSTSNVNVASSNCNLDCSGSSSPPAPCDSGLPFDGPAADFAKAIGVCQMADATHWGLVSATYTRGYNSTAAPAAGQHGLMAGFGSVIKPRQGSTLAILSSGYALPCDDANPGASCSGSGQSDPYFKGPQAGMYNGAGSSPPGYPKSTAACKVAASVLDTIGVTLQIKVPSNALGFSFDFDFYSGEWPEYVCTEFNDSFVAWLQSTAWKGTNGNGDLNISFDAMGNAVSVNNGFFEHCTPNTQTGCSGTNTQTAACTGGASELQGTGFYNMGTYCSGPSTGGGATGWLTTKAPVTGGETITLQFIIWDTGDQNWDSSVLVDNLTWYGTATTTGTGVAN